MYILECSDGSYYTGHTDDLEKRLAEHEQKTFKCYTSKRLPVKLVFCSDFSSRIDALESERRIKGWSRLKKQALINGDWQELVRLSKCRGDKKPFNPSTSSGRTEENAVRG